MHVFKWEIKCLISWISWWSFLNWSDQRQNKNIERPSTGDGSNASRFFLQVVCHINAVHWTIRSVLHHVHCVKRSLGDSFRSFIKKVNKSQSQLVWSFESQSRVKVKVVKWCRKKWFDHNQMYIYHKQCEILQKNHRNSSNIQFQWFPIEKGRKLCKRKRWNGWSKSIF